MEEDTYCPGCGEPLMLSKNVAGGSLVGACAKCGISFLLDSEDSLEDEPDKSKVLAPKVPDRFVECPECNKSISDDNEFCYHCGADLKDRGSLKTVTKPQLPIETSKQSSRSGGAVMGVILLVFGIILLIIRKDLTLEIVGKNKALEEVFTGGDSVEVTLYSIIVIATISLLIGAVITVKGLTQKPHSVKQESNSDDH